MFVVSLDLANGRTSVDDNQLYNALGNAPLAGFFPLKLCLLPHGLPPQLILFFQADLNTDFGDFFNVEAVEIYVGG